MLDALLAHKSGTVAVYRSIEFDSYILASRASALTLKVGPPWEIDLDEPPDLWSSASGPLEYQGIGTFYHAVPLTLMVEERLASIDEMCVDPDWLDFNETEFPLNALEELQRHKLL